MKTLVWIEWTAPMIPEKQPHYKGYRPGYRYEYETRPGCMLIWEVRA